MPDWYEYSLLLFITVIINGVSFFVLNTRGGGGAFHVPVHQYEELGWAENARTARDTTRAAQELLATLEPAQSYIDIIRALNDSQANRILRDSR
jgi:hypothetical protein